MQLHALHIVLYSVFDILGNVKNGAAQNLTWLRVILRSRVT